ncbi:MAG TPA: SHOCT domain-containing protein [Actinomycetota bacterium]|jgi:hypothetical protein|nr:SHOCT domain-containing protein [Actinomycetota bacterium]
MNVLDFLWQMIIIFAFVMYLMVLFFIIMDLFRDHGLSGWWKAVWIVCLFLFTYLAALAYLIFRGKGMAERNREAQKAAIDAQQAYIKQAAGTAGPAEQITQAQALLSSGAITQEEFDKLKAKALAS